MVAPNYKTVKMKILCKKHIVYDNNSVFHTLFSCLDYILLIFTGNIPHAINQRKEKRQKFLA